GDDLAQLCPVRPDDAGAFRRLLKVADQEIGRSLSLHPSPSVARVRPPRWARRCGGPVRFPPSSPGQSYRAAQSQDDVVYHSGIAVNRSWRGARAPALTGTGTERSGWNDARSTRGAGRIATPSSRPSR